MTLVHSTAMRIEIDTRNHSEAVELILLPLTSREVQIGWISGSDAIYQVRRRDQVRFLLAHFGITMPLGEISYGRFANWCKGTIEV